MLLALILFGGGGALATTTIVVDGGGEHHIWSTFGTNINHKIERKIMLIRLFPGEN